MPLGPSEGFWVSEFVLEYARHPTIVPRVAPSNLFCFCSLNFDHISIIVLSSIDSVFYTTVLKPLASRMQCLFMTPRLPRLSLWPTRTSMQKSKTLSPGNMH